jgi:hypothetical protein
VITDAYLSLLTGNLLAIPLMIESKVEQNPEPPEPPTDIDSVADMYDAGAFASPVYVTPQNCGTVQAVVVVFGAIFASPHSKKTLLTI